MVDVFVGGIRVFPLKVVVLVLTSFISVHEGDRGCLHCAQLQSFIAAGADCDVV